MKSDRLQDDLCLRETKAGGKFFDQNKAATGTEIHEFQKATIDLDCFVMKVLTKVELIFHSCG